MITNPDNHPIMGGSGVCECLNQYSLSPHGDGFALYLGRCPHRHGYNLANITEPDTARMKMMVELLNAGVAGFASLKGSHEEAWKRVREYDISYQKALDERDALRQEVSDQHAMLERITRHWTADAPVAVSNDEAARDLMEGLKERNSELERKLAEWRKMAATLADAYTNPDSSIMEVEGAVHLFKQMEQNETSGELADCNLAELVLRGLRAAEGAQVSLEALCREGDDPCNNDNYCRLLDWIREVRRVPLGGLRDDGGEK